MGLNIHSIFITVKCYWEMEQILSNTVSVTAETINQIKLNSLKIVLTQSSFIESHVVTTWTIDSPNYQ